jgi:hypothetical protein
MNMGEPPKMDDTLKDTRNNTQNTRNNTRNTINNTRNTIGRTELGKLMRSRALMIPRELITEQYTCVQANKIIDESLLAEEIFDTWRRVAEIYDEWRRATSLDAGVKALAARATLDPQAVEAGTTDRGIAKPPESATAPDCELKPAKDSVAGDRPSCQPAPVTLISR